MLDLSSEPASPSFAGAVLAPRAEPLVREQSWASLRQPAALFALLSIVFGTVVILITPPMRGPDEAAHFLRVYGFVQGALVATETDAEGRKGLFLPPRLYRDFDLFESNRYRIWDRGFSYRDVFSEYARRRGQPAASGDDPPVFVIFNGSEGYSPFSYLPYLPAAAAARVLGLDFLVTIYLMRFMGLVAMTAIAAYAIAIVPRLGWGFFCIAMLPAALYGRCMISADGGALSYTMAVAALCLRGVVSPNRGTTWEHGAWMTLCILSKPPQLAFAVLELLWRPLRQLPRDASALAWIILPGVALTVAWTAATSGDVASWRLTGGTGLPPEQFEAAWKLGFMLEHPLHFPAVMATTIVNHVPDLWRQLIGMLGWLDTRLVAWAYPTLSVLLVVVLIVWFVPADTMVAVVALVGVTLRLSGPLVPVTFSTSEWMSSPSTTPP